jgi:hypothetical protein
MGDGFDTGQKLIEAFCDIETLVAENGRLRAAIAEHRSGIVVVTEFDRKLWSVLEEGNDDG